LILENAATNYARESSNLSRLGSQSPVNAVTFTRNNTTAPDGSQTALKISADGTNGDPHVGDSGSTSVSGTYTFSVWMWTDSSQNKNAQLYLYDSGIAQVASQSFTLTTTPTRYSITQTFSGTISPVFRIDLQPNTAQYIYAWGAQLEAGYAPTSFIYTNSSAVTRSADVASSTAYTRAVDKGVMYKLNDFYNEDEGTLYAEHNVDRDITSGAWGVVQFNDTTTDNYIGIRYRSSGTTGEIVTDDSGTSISAQSKIGADLDYFPKSVIAYKQNDFAGMTSGGTLATDTSGQVPNITQLVIGTGEGINTINGHIKKIAYYPERLSNAELQALTENN
jgi:hypothetical protein